MPDIEAPAPVAEAPAAPPTAKQSDAARIAAAAEVMAKLEAKPFDPALDGKGKEAPTEETAEEPPAEPAGDAPRDVTVAEWRQYTSQKRKLERKEQAFQAREAHATELERKLVQFEAEKKLLRENPKAFWAKLASEHGSDFTAEYSKFADAYISEGAPGAKLDTALKRIEELEIRIAKEKEAEKADKETRARAHWQQRIEEDFVRVATADEHKATGYTFKKYGKQTVIADALGVGSELAAKLGRAATDGEIARELDSRYQKYYKEIVDSHSSLSTPQPGDTERVNGAGSPAKPVAPKAPKTLTNGGSAERAAPARKLTERERIEAATKLLPG